MPDVQKSVRKGNFMSYLISFFVSVMADVTAYIVKKWIDKH